MLDVLESGKENSLDCFDVQTLSFDHPLTPFEIEEFKSIIFSINNLSQIYFKGTIDVKSIEIIKNLLSISGYVDDEKIEKYVAVKLTPKEMDQILSSKYENPSTWKICYYVEENNYMLIELPKCRLFFSYVDRIKLLSEKEGLTPFESVLRIYDITKLLEYNGNLTEEANLLPDIIVNKEASSYGFNSLFSYILRKLGMKTFMGKEKSLDGKESYVTIVEIKDDKYEIDGIYLFDPSMDTLPKETYKTDDIRMINYNYFGLMLADIENSTYKDKLTGALGILAIDDFNYSNEKKNSKDISLQRELDLLNKTFGYSYRQLYNKINHSRPISFEQIEQAVANVYGENKTIPDYNKLIRENYFSRRGELFNPNTNELLNVLLK